MIVIVVTGSRDYANEAQIRADLETYRGHAVTLYHGDCRIRGVGSGADALADRVARGLGFRVEPVPVVPELDGPWPLAGPNRSERMLGMAQALYSTVSVYPLIDDASPSMILVLAYRWPWARNRGTTRCVQMARELGLPVYERHY